MPQDPKQLRRQLFADPALGEHARDTQKALDSIPGLSIRTVPEARYEEPMMLAGLPQKPRALVLIGCIDLTSQDQPVVAGSYVDFTWVSQQVGARITSIDGMSPLTHPSTYQFTYLVIH